MRLARRASVALAAVVAAIGGACATVPEEFVDAAGVACPSGSDCYDEPRPAGPGGSLTVLANEFEFELEQVRAVEGPIEVNLDNVGGAPHTFTIDEAYGETKEVYADGGEQVKGTLELFPGDYVYYCSIAGHRGQGMEGVLTVEPAGVTGSATPTEDPGGQGGATPGEPGPEGDEPSGGSDDLSPAPPAPTGG